jgi:hypothetical protein
MRRGPQHQDAKTPIPFACLYGPPLELSGGEFQNAEEWSIPPGEYFEAET